MWEGVFRVRRPLLYQKTRSTHNPALPPGSQFLQPTTRGVLQIVTHLEFALDRLRLQRQIGVSLQSRLDAAAVPDDRIAQPRET